MIESAFVIEKTCFGLPNTDLGAFGECPRFHLYSFQGPSLWYLCSSGKSSYSIEILQNFAQKSSNHLLSMNKLSFDHWWYTAERFLELACASHILPPLLCAWIFESLKIVMKSLETLHKWSNQSSLLKKPDLDYQAEILVFLESVLDFTYIAFKGLLCGIFYPQPINGNTDNAYMMHGDKIVHVHQLFGIVQILCLPMTKEWAMQTRCAFILELWYHSKPKIKLFSACCCFLNSSYPI